MIALKRRLCLCSFCFVVILEFPQSKVLLHLGAGNTHKLPKLISLPLLNREEEMTQKYPPPLRESGAEPDQSWMMEKTLLWNKAAS